MLKLKIFSVILLTALFSVKFANSQIDLGVSISANIAPPALPVYVQPPCPYDGYIWTPGYWAYDPVDGYYWVPGVWVQPPQFGYLWTPCWWGYVGGVYGFHRGYWGPHVGFYGGVNYGYGYGGVGYGGGRWDGHIFRYNTAVTNVNQTIVHNVYVDRSVGRSSGGRTSFNGPGGTNARPTSQETAAMHERHVDPTSQQMSHQQTSAKDRSQFANVNHGKPAVAAMNSVGGQRFNASGRAANTQSAQHQQPGQQHSAAANNNRSGSSQNFHAQQPGQARQQQPQQSRQQVQRTQQQPQQSHQQPQLARQQPQQFHQQLQQAHPQPPQAHPQPQAHQQAPQGHRPGR